MSMGYTLGTTVEASDFGSYENQTSNVLSSLQIIVYRIP